MASSIICSFRQLIFGLRYLKLFHSELLLAANVVLLRPPAPAQIQSRETNLNGSTSAITQGASRRIGSRAGSGTTLSTVTQPCYLSNFRRFRQLSPAKCRRKRRKCDKRNLQKILDLRTFIPLDIVSQLHGAVQLWLIFSPKLRSGS